MVKKIPIVLFVFCLITGFTSRYFFSSEAPSGYSGEFGNTCVSCHGSFAQNSGGGNVTITGLPTGSYVPGQSYPITVTISHGTSDRTRWGFALAARNASGEFVGTFTSTNSNAAIIGDAEIGHSSAVITPASSSYTYNNMRWVAPASPTPNDYNLNFFVVGNAANNNSGTTGDYIHANVINRVFTPIPVTLSRFVGKLNQNLTVELQWETAQEQNSYVFIIERSTDGQNFSDIDRIPAAGNSTLPRSYQYTDKAPPISTHSRAFYRLKQVDIDGKINYSRSVSIQLKRPASILELTVSNVVKKGARLTARFIAEKPMDLQIVVSDAKGKQVFASKPFVATGANTISLPSHAFAHSTGIYYLTVRAGNFKQTERILVL